MIVIIVYKIESEIVESRLKEIYDVEAVMGSDRKIKQLTQRYDYSRLIFNQGINCETVVFNLRQLY